MEVRITFSGMCLFVPEPTAANPLVGRMHVLLPRQDQPHSVVRHAPVLTFDTGHLRFGGSPENLSVHVLLRDQVLALPGWEAETKFCPQIVDLKPVVGRNVDPDQLGPDQNRRLVSRVTLGGGRMTHVAPGHCWKWDPEIIRPLAHQARWSLEWPDVPLRLVLKHLRVNEETELPPLYPMGGIINLAVHHVPHSELPFDAPPLPPPPPPETQPEHFRAFYNVFGADTPTLLPRYKGDLAGCRPVSDPCDELPDMGGSPFTCMLAGVTP